MASLEQAKIPINRERKQRSRIEAEKHIITVHGLPCTEIINSATIRLASEMSLIVTNFTISLSSSSCTVIMYFSASFSLLCVHAIFFDITKAEWEIKIYSEKE